MAEAARYLFDRTFDTPVRGSKLQEEWDRKMAEACSAAFEDGRAEGVAETRKGLEADTRDQVNTLLQSAQQLLDQVECECNAIRKNAIKLATTTATLLAEELTNRMPTANLEALFGEALEHIGDTPHIAFSVNDALVDSVQKTVSSIAAERGFTGNIVVISDPETKGGDCCLQWADGGILLEQDKTRSAISGIVERHLDKMYRDSEAPPAAAGMADASLPADTAEATDDTGSTSQSETDIESEAMTGSGEQK